jgi:enamine deaminase RidA (YjgF/YER057c/UK114 family)
VTERGEGIRRRVAGYSPWEDEIGFCRALVVDGGAARVLVSGTTSTVDGVVRHPGDGYLQLRQALDTVQAVLREAGTDLSQVVRTRMYVVGAEHCDDVGRAHREVFGDIRPVATMVIVAGLIHPDMVAEVEVEAVLAPPPTDRPRIVPL